MKFHEQAGRRTVPGFILIFFLLAAGFGVIWRGARVRFYRERAEAALRERATLTRLALEVSQAFASREPVPTALQGCCAAVVRNLGAALARIWTLEEGATVLELQASAGLYTHIDGPHRQIPVGQFKIGLIAAEKKPHLTNSVIGDPQVADQDWAKKEGLVAFARHPLSEATFEARRKHDLESMGPGREP
jgi:hypothetical protein